MSYSDRHFSDNFCRSCIAACRQNIESATSFNLVAMSGVGVTFFVRALAQDKPGEFVFVNSYELHDFSKQALYEQLGQKLGLAGDEAKSLQAIHLALADRAANNERVVLVFNRLDRLSAELDQNFYDNLRYLRDSYRGKIVMIFVTSRPILELSAPNIKDFFSLVNQVTYFGGYSPEDLSEIAQATGGESVDPRAIDLSGGHHALMLVLSRCQNLNNPLSDPMVELLIKDLYFGLDVKRRKQLDGAVKRKNPVKDDFLNGVGFVKPVEPMTFTPLLAEYILQQGKQHLPVKEKRLLRLLILHKGKLVTKEEIADYVWREANGVVSDWALNALIYRLRRHPTFDNQRYTIESRKKDGYILFDHTLK